MPPAPDLIRRILAARVYDVAVRTPLDLMPRTTPSIKVEAVRALGGEVDLAGDTYDDAHLHARQREVSEGLAFIHPFDDLDVIAGQGTVAVELLLQQPSLLDAIFVCVGGGGLPAGIAVYTKFLQPATRIVACEADDAACFAAARAKGARVTLQHVGLFADGATVKQVGAHPWEITRDTVVDALTVTTDEICSAMRLIFEDLRTIAEPAGALGVAGLLKWATVNPGTTPIAAILSGANLNFGRLQHVAERAEFGAGTEALFAVVMPERPGAFRAFCAAVGERNITEFNYRLGDRDRAAVLVGVRVEAGGRDREALSARCFSS